MEEVSTIGPAFTRLSTGLASQYADVRDRHAAGDQAAMQSFNAGSVAYRAGPAGMLLHPQKIMT
jgi:hypothetical protein